MSQGPPWKRQRAHAGAPARFREPGQSLDQSAVLLVHRTVVVGAAVDQYEQCTSGEGVLDPLNGLPAAAGRIGDGLLTGGTLPAGVVVSEARQDCRDRDDCVGVRPMPLTEPSPRTAARPSRNDFEPS